MKALVILRDGSRHEIDVDDDLARLPALDFALPFDSSWYIGRGVPVFRER